MNLRDLKEALRAYPHTHVRFKLPDGTAIAAHAHVTEAARIDKRFIDCGGTFREESLCRLQTWVAQDFDHRLTAGKLLKILDKATPVLISEALDVDIEHETRYISQFPLASVSVDEEAVTLHLSERHTACLALDQCCPKPKEILGFPVLREISK